jgi:cobalt-precorrin 5A hydrolase / precorrin-3B C17-methyltransferase
LASLKPNLTVVTASGIATARRIADALDVPLHGRPDGTDAPVDNLGAHLRERFIGGTPIVFVGALGALVRLLATVISDKAEDPAVVAVAEDGGAVIPVLGGHHGANDLARRVAGILGIAPAITTASDLRFGVALDDPPTGWHLANIEAYKGFMARLLAQPAVWVEGEIPWLEDTSLPIDENAALTIRASVTAADPGQNTLLYHPETLALGVGCERDVAPEELIALARKTLAEADLAPESVAAVVSVDVKMDETAVHTVAAALGRPARFFTPEQLEAETPRLANPSDIVFHEVGCHGVAEAAALAAVGARGELLVEKNKTKRATCAIARAPSVIDAAEVGKPRGRLFVVGTGPGMADWRSPEVDRLVSLSTDLVGYGLYLDLLGPLAEGKTRHGYQLGEERDRVIAALNLAGEGRTVSLVCSGDPGIYAMASLVFECLDDIERRDWRRVEVVVSPGISALQACAARIGAPLGHDFCTISLSDLLTPWEAIERRLHAAAEGDFVIAFYNPASLRRRSQLVRALEILRSHRPATTPVIVGKSLGRPEESLTVTPLEDFDPETVDMLSMVMVGSSQTRLSAGRVYTPRGYAVAASDQGKAAS